MAEDFEFVSREEAYWIERKETSESVITQHEKDMKEIPLHNKFHRAIIRVCNKRIKTLKKARIEKPQSEPK